MTTRDEALTPPAKAPARAAAFRPTVSAHALVALVDELRRRGVAPEPFLREYGIESAPSPGAEDRFPAPSLEGLWLGAAEAAGDPLFGLHAARAVEEHTFGVFSYLAATSDTWGRALERVCRYFRILTDAGRYELSLTGDAAVLSYQASPMTPPAAVLCDFVLAVPFTYGVRNVEGFRVSELLLPYAAPAHAKAIREFFRAPTRFAAGALSMVFAAELLSAPLRTASPHLAALLEGVAADKLAALPGSQDPLPQVRKAIADALRAGHVSLSATARKLGVAPRSLQRRLRELGTGYAAELDGVRRELGMVLVLQPGLSLQEVGFLLGFSEPAAFQRAFRRWTGVPPGRFREQKQGD